MGSNFLCLAADTAQPFCPVPRKEDAAAFRHPVLLRYDQGNRHVTARQTMTGEIISATFPARTTGLHPVICPADVAKVRAEASRTVGRALA